MDEVSTVASVPAHCSTSAGIAGRDNRRRGLGRGCRPTSDAGTRTTELPTGDRQQRETMANVTDINARERMVQKRRTGQVAGDSGTVTGDVAKPRLRVAMAHPLRVAIDTAQWRFRARRSARFSWRLKRGATAGRIDTRDTRRFGHRKWARLAGSVIADDTDPVRVARASRILWPSQIVGSAHPQQDARRSPGCGHALRPAKHSRRLPRSRTATPCDGHDASRPHSRRSSEVFDLVRSTGSARFERARRRRSNLGPIAHIEEHARVVESAFNASTHGTYERSTADRPGSSASPTCRPTRPSRRAANCRRRQRVLSRVGRFRFT